MIGHNDRIAWGFTTTASDVEDLFIEKLDPSRPRPLSDPGRQRRRSRRAQETIAVRDAAPVTMTVRSTRHGPVLSDMLPAGTRRGRLCAGARGARSSTEDDRSAASVVGHRPRRRLDSNFATRCSELRRAAAEHRLCRYRRRRSGSSRPATSRFAAAATAGCRCRAGPATTTGQGLIPFDELPQASNPPSGHFVSANNKIVPDSLSLFPVARLGYAEPGRAHRRTARRRAAPVARRQRRDPGRHAVDHGAPPGAADDAASRPRDDRRAKRSSGCAAGISGWMPTRSRRCCSRLGCAPLPRRCSSVGWAMPAEEYWDLRPQVMRKRVDRDIPEWCADPQHRRGTARPAATARLAAALDRRARRACATATARIWRMAMGPRPYREVSQPGILAHAGAARLDRRRDPDGRRVRHGEPRVDARSATTSIPTSSARRRLADHHRSRRRRPTSRMIAVPGQSGNPLSPHFSDLLRRWRDFDWLVPGKAAPVATLTLEPAQ